MQDIHLHIIEKTDSYLHTQYIYINFQTEALRQDDFRIEINYRVMFTYLLIFLLFKIYFFIQCILIMVSSLSTSPRSPRSIFLSSKSFPFPFQEKNPKTRHLKKIIKLDKNKQTGISQNKYKQLKRASPKEQIYRCRDIQVCTHRNLKAQNQKP